MLFTVGERAQIPAYKWQKAPAEMAEGAAGGEEPKKNSAGFLPPLYIQYHHQFLRTNQFHKTAFFRFSKQGHEGMRVPLGSLSYSPTSTD